tara:strand:- start:246 stop:356 length:111 start_codon:yes stop_codon:yes gene_type:complete
VVALVVQVKRHHFHLMDQMVEQVLQQEQKLLRQQHQ